MNKLMLAFALSTLVLPAWAKKSCDELKTEIAAKLDEKGAEAVFRAGVDLETSYGYTTADEGRATASQVSVMQAYAAGNRLPIDMELLPDGTINWRRSPGGRWRCLRRGGSARPISWTMTWRPPPGRPACCRCTPDQVIRYRGKLSGPLLDRIDLTVEVHVVTADCTRVIRNHGTLEDLAVSVQAALATVAPSP